MTTLAIIAKQPVAGFAKTRLHPPLTLEQAASLAAACIDDTLAAVESLPVSRRVLVYDGELLPPNVGGFDIVPQSSGGLDERIAAVFDESTGPLLLVGMDTPQLSRHHLAPVVPDWPEDIDAWFGPATDGGYWALGLREPRGDLIRGVPMSMDDTGAIQLERLRGAGLRVGMLEPLTDIDTIADALAVATVAPHTGFARLLKQFLTTDHRATDAAARPGTQ